MKVFGCISLMSAPAAKAFSLPARTMHPILSSASRSSTAAAISLKTPKDSALSSFGRLSVMTPTAPLPSTMMCSNVLMVYPAPDCTGLCPLAARASRGLIPSRTARESRPLECYAMNMRAAEAMVSSAPKPMKIFPISEVWSQAEGSVFGSRDDGRRGRWLGRGHCQRARGRRAVAQRAIDVVELIGGDDLGIGCRLSVGRHVDGALDDRVGPRRHRLGVVVGRRIGDGELGIGVGDRGRNRGWLDRGRVGVAVRGISGIFFGRGFLRHLVVRRVSSSGVKRVWYSCSASRELLQGLPPLRLPRRHRCRWLPATGLPGIQIVPSR